MALNNETLRECTRRLLLSRMRLLCHHGFYGLLLLHMRYAVDEEVETACTDGVRITFGVDFLESLTDEELDFVMMHEVLHVVLQHCLRQGERDRELFNIACDTVVNSNILLENRMNEKSISLAEYGVSMHLAPNGEEGHLYTAEEVYHMLLDEAKKQAKKQGQTGNSGGEDASGGGGGAGQKGKDSAASPKSGTPDQANRGQTPQGSGGSSSGNGGNQGKNQGRPQSGNGAGGASGNSASGGGKTAGGALSAGWDDHSRWKEADGELEDVWLSRMEGAIAVMEASQNCGSLPGFAERILKERRNPTVHWRELLDRFVKEEVTDYTFSPPDRRYDGDFFLPDFNDRDEDVGRILFMVDTSGSISDRMLTDAYGEILGAVEEFGGKLEGYLGFFDSVVYPPKPFTEEKELLKIRPKGGGGTSFTVIFDYLSKLPPEEKPKSLVILTDGYAPYPEERAAEGIPVLWLMSTAVTPPFGKVARMDPKKK